MQKEPLVYNIQNLLQNFIAFYHVSEHTMIKKVLISREHVRVNQ